MKTVTGILAIACGLSVSISAQWLKYPTAGVPRASDGKPDLGAPAPRAADGRPDLSGIWDIEHNRPCPPGGCADMEVGQEFVDIGWSLKGGLPYQPWAAAERKTRVFTSQSQVGGAVHNEPASIDSIVGGSCIRACTWEPS